MGSSLQNWHRNNHLSISFFFFFLLFSAFIFIHVTPIAEGRGIQGSPSSSPEQAEKMGMMRSALGSRPPSCRRRCRECGGHCEAVQVPVAMHDSHQNQRKKRSSHFSAPVKAPAASASKYDVTLSSEDEASNYKPISWKCKCGNFIFNP